MQLHYNRGQCGVFEMKLLFTFQAILIMFEIFSLIEIRQIVLNFVCFGIYKKIDEQLRLSQPKSDKPVL